MNALKLPLASTLLALVGACSDASFGGGTPVERQMITSSAAASVKTQPSDTPTGTPAVSTAEGTDATAANIPPTTDGSAGTDKTKTSESATTPSVPVGGAASCGDGCVKVCGTKIQFTNFQGNVTGGAVSASGSTATVELVSPANRKASVKVQADTECKVSVKLQSGYPFMCHVQADDICAPAVSPSEGGLAPNCFSPVFYTVNGGGNLQLSTSGFQTYTHSDGANRPCPERNSCVVAGAGGVVHFTGSLTMQECVAQCGGMSDFANRTCTYAGKYNVRM